MTSQRGFTLPELLVALLIFSVIATATALALRLGVNARDQLDEAGDRLAALRAARILIKEDLAQIALRPVRDEFGTASPPFRGGIEAFDRNAPRGETRLAAFVRAGWSNPGGDAPRSNLQYVEYVAKDRALIRRIRPFLDDARGQARFERKLIKDADGLEMKFLAGEVRGELEWVAAWPPPQSQGAAPRAISIAFKADRYGDISELFWIGDLAARAPR